MKKKRKKKGVEASFLSLIHSTTLEPFHPYDLQPTLPRILTHNPSFLILPSLPNSSKVIPLPTPFSTPKSYPLSNPPPNPLQTPPHCPLISLIQRNTILLSRQLFFASDLNWEMRNTPAGHALQQFTPTQELWWSPSIPSASCPAVADPGSG